MKIKSYKYHSATWQVDEGGERIDSTKKVEEKFYSNDNPIVARREGLAFIFSIMDSLYEAQTEMLRNKQLYPPLVYHIRFSYILENDLRCEIYSFSNYVDVTEEEINKIAAYLNQEVDLYILNGYDLGGDIQIVIPPDGQSAYKVLYDTGIHYKDSLNQSK